MSLALKRISFGGLAAHVSWLSKDFFLQLRRPLCGRSPTFRAADSFLGATPQKFEQKIIGTGSSGWRSLNLLCGLNGERGGAAPEIKAQCFQKVKDLPHIGRRSRRRN
jgi:hypothetical protein